jgi:2-oxoglutarate dehydrogenase complex dehydrogenase (E1) component-like enzyme
MKNMIEYLRKIQAQQVNQFINLYFTFLKSPFELAAEYEEENMKWEAGKWPGYLRGYGAITRYYPWEEEERPRGKTDNNYTNVAERFGSKRRTA